MYKTICVYSSSSFAVDQTYFNAAAALGRKIAEKGDSLLFGGGMVGLMGATAKAVHEYKGRVIGVIPEALNQKGIVYELCDELIVTPGMRERKAVMDERSDAFIALPGGYGTLEELLEIITLKQLKYHNKPIVLINIDGFYDKLLEQFDFIIKGRFAKPENTSLYHVACDIDNAIEYIDNYKPVEHEIKWFTNVEKG